MGFSHKQRETENSTIDPQSKRQCTFASRDPLTVSNEER